MVAEKDPKQQQRASPLTAEIGRGDWAECLKQLRSANREVRDPERRIEVMSRAVVNAQRRSGPAPASLIAELESMIHRSGANPALCARCVRRIRGTGAALGGFSEAGDKFSLTAPQSPPDAPTGPEARSANTLAVQIDPEVGRLFVALNLPGAYRLYSLALQKMRQGDSGTFAQHSIEIQSLYQAQQEAGIHYSRSTFYKHIAAGMDLCWRGRHKGRLYVHSQKNIAVHLAKMAFAKQMPQLLAWDRPGTRNCYVELGGSLQQFLARLYTAWLAVSGPIISRAMLQGLWNRESKALLQWARLADNLRVQRNYAQTITPQDLRIPDHACPAIIGDQNGWIWQRPNTFLVYPKPPTHHANGQRRKVRTAVNEICRQHGLLNKSEGALVGVRNSVGRLPDHIAELPAREQYRLEYAAQQEALKRYQKAMRRAPEVGTKDYVYLGRRRQKWRPFGVGKPAKAIWELMLLPGHPDYHEMPLSNATDRYLRAN